LIIYVLSGSLYVWKTIFDIFSEIVKSKLVLYLTLFRCVFSIITY